MAQAGNDDQFAGQSERVLRHQFQLREETHEFRFRIRHTAAHTVSSRAVKAGLFIAIPVGADRDCRLHWAEIEARGIGIISVPFVNDVPLSLIVDLSNSVNERMPEYDTESQFGISVRRIGRAPLDAFAQAIYLMCVGGKEL